jgi:hypothetical protein
MAALSSRLFHFGSQQHRAIRFDSITPMMFEDFSTGDIAPRHGHLRPQNARKSVNVGCMSARTCETSGYARTIKAVIFGAR